MAIEVGFLDSAAVKIFAGVFAGAASALTIHQIILQLKNFHNPKLQVCICKMLFAADSEVLDQKLAYAKRRVVLCCRMKIPFLALILCVNTDLGVQDPFYGPHLLAGQLSPFGHG